MASYFLRLPRTSREEVEAKVNELESQGFVVRQILGDAGWEIDDPRIKVVIFYSDRDSLHSLVGYNESCPVGVDFDLWAGPTPLVPYPAAPVSLEVVSLDLNNSLAGTGAQKVTLHLLDNNYATTITEIELNGTTPVPVTGSWYRINPSLVTQVGSYGAVQGGAVHVREAGGGTVYDAIPVDWNQSTRAFATMPAGFYPRLMTWDVKLTLAKQNDEISFTFRRRPPGEGWRILDFSGLLNQDHQTYGDDLFYNLYPGDDIRIAGYTDAASVSSFGRFSYTTAGK